MLRICALFFILMLLGACSPEQNAASPAPRWHDAIRPDAKLPNLERQNPGDPLSPLVFTREQAFLVLLNAEQFSPRRYGYGNAAIGLPTIAYGTLLEQPDAVEVFQALTQRATPAGRIYALCGLYTKDQNAFEQALTQLKPEKSHVSFAPGGCMIYSPPYEQLVESISKGKHPRDLQSTLTDLKRRQTPPPHTNPSQSPAAEAQRPREQNH